MKGKTEHFQYVSNEMSQMSDNMCISCPSAVVAAYWDPGGLAHFLCNKFEGIFKTSEQICCIETVTILSFDIQFELELEFILKEKKSTIFLCQTTVLFIPCTASSFHSVISIVFKLIKTQLKSIQISKKLYVPVEICLCVISWYMHQNLVSEKWPSTSLWFRKVHYINTIGHCIIAKTVYEDINLMDLEAAGHPPAHSSKTYMWFLSVDIW